MKTLIVLKVGVRGKCGEVLVKCGKVRVEVSD